MQCVHFIVQLRQLSEDQYGHAPFTFTQCGAVGGAAEMAGFAQMYRLLLV